MAEQKEIEITLDWQNGDHFKMLAKLENSDEKVTVVEMEENGHLATLWGHLEQICITFFRENLAKIGKEMKRK